MLLFKAKYMWFYNWLRGLSGRRRAAQSGGLRTRAELQGRIEGSVISRAAARRKLARVIWLSK